MLSIFSSWRTLFLISLLALMIAQTSGSPYFGEGAHLDIHKRQQTGTGASASSTPVTPSSSPSSTPTTPSSRSSTTPTPSDSSSTPTPSQSSSTPSSTPQQSSSTPPSSSVTSIVSRITVVSVMSNGETTTITFSSTDTSGGNPIQTGTGGGNGGDGGGGTNTKAIVGGVVGGVGGAIVLAALAFLLLRWAKNRRPVNNDFDHDIGTGQGLSNSGADKQNLASDEAHNDRYTSRPNAAANF